MIITVTALAKADTLNFGLSSCHEAYDLAAQSRLNCAEFSAFFPGGVDFPLVADDIVSRAVLILRDRHAATGEAEHVADHGVPRFVVGGRMLFV